MSAAVLVMGLFGCVPEGDDGGADPGGAVDAAQGRRDGGPATDAGQVVDGAARRDAADAPDAARPMDASGRADGGAPADAVVGADAGGAGDAAAPVDGAVRDDAGRLDGGGEADGAPADAALADAAPADAAPADAAPADAEPANAPPTVRFLSPRAGATVTGPITVRVAVSDDHDALGDGLTVTLTVDGVEVGALDADGEIAWTPAFRAGPRTLRALATDARGATSEVERAVTVDHPATLALHRCVADDCEPVDGARIRGPLTLRPHWRDDDDAPTSLALRVDGTFVRAGLAPGEPFDFDPADLDDGPHRLEVVGASGDDVGVSAAADVVVARCDFDGDGARAEACGGADCDDDRADVRPGADDPVGDGVDADCDGVDGCAPARCPVEGALPFGGGPLSPGARLTSFRPVQRAAEAEALGCPELGSRGVRYGDLMATLIGQADPAQPDDAGHVSYRLAARVTNWQPGQTLSDVGAPAVVVQAAYRARDGQLTVPTRGADGAWPQTFAGPLDGARVDATGDAWVLPVLIATGLPGPALSAARLTGVLAVDGTDFSLTEGRLDGLLTDRALRDLTAEAFAVCRAGPAPLDCGPLVGLLTGDRITDGQLVASLLGGFDARLGADGPEPCAEPRDCDALTVCVAVTMRGERLEPIEARPGGPCDDQQDCVQGQCLPFDEAGVPGGVCVTGPCDVDADCGPAGRCDGGRGGICWQTCDADGDCRAGWHCDADGACVPPCDLVPCVPGTLCDPESRRCVAEGPGCQPACGPDTVCLPGNRCVAPDRQCADDRGCPVGTACEDAVCVGPPGGGCLDPLDCAADADCQGGVCTVPCRDDGDCALHLACRDGVCEAVACEANYDVCAAGPGRWTGTCLHVADDGGLRCLQGGTVPVGGACDPGLVDREAAAALCAPGSACFTAPQVSPDGRRGQCAPVCAPDRIDDCGDGEVCLDLARGAAGGPLAVCVPSDCQVFDGGCGAGARCLPWGIDAGIGRCAPPGPILDFGACDFDSDCASSALCADPGGGPVCLPVCLDDADCPPDRGCYLDDGWAIGLCV